MAELVAHINWWNRWMLDIIELGQALPYPAHAADTWPEVQAGDWSRVKNEFYELLGRIDPHAARPDLANPVNHEETIGELLADMALHTAHHFGQVVTVRQALGVSLFGIDIIINNQMGQHAVIDINALGSPNMSDEWHRHGFHIANRSIIVRRSLIII